MWFLYCKFAFIAGDKFVVFKLKDDAMILEFCVTQEDVYGVSPQKCRTFIRSAAV